MPFLRGLGIAVVLVVLVFVASALLFRSEHDDNDSDATDLVDAIADLHREYLDPMQVTLDRAVGCRDASLPSADPSCEALVDRAQNLDPVVVDLIARFESHLGRVGPTADVELVNGIQRNLRLATSSHEFNALLVAARAESDQSKWDASWALWDDLIDELEGTSGPTSAVPGA